MKARRSRRRGGRATPRCSDRDLCHRRAPDRAEADHPPGLGAAGHAPDRAPHATTASSGSPSPPRSPATGESFWYLSSGVDKALFEDTLALFAREAGAGRDRIAILVLDGAGWHTAPGLAVPEGIRLVYLPPYTPELQPAETLWVHVDEPIVNEHFETLAGLDAAVAAQGAVLNADRSRVKGQAGFHWWPAPVAPN